MERRTFYHDETKNFRIPNEVYWGDTMRLYLRTGRYQVQEATLLFKDEEYEMLWEYSKNGFDYYSAVFTVSKDTREYCFRIKCEGEYYYYGRTGIEEKEKIVPFSIIPGYSIPAWQRGAVMYQIFPDRFCNGDPSNDVKDGEYIYMDRPVRHVDWDRSETATGVWDFCGGDLQGIIDRLDYLKDLGVEVLYLNPIFKSPSNHKYDTTDYDSIDPHLGTNELFIRLVELVHEKGMRIIIDGVFNHCGCDNVWMNRNCDPAVKDGAYGERDSKYHDYFRFSDYYCTEYESWWNVPTLPKLNYEGSEELVNDILRIAKKWVSAPYNADGWRLDVAADLGHSEKYNHSFWRKFRNAVKSCGPDKFILAEHYGNPSSWLNGDEWDSIMNYDGFMDPVSFFFTGTDKHSDGSNRFLEGNAVGFAESLKKGLLMFHSDSCLCAMNQLDNHDHSRFLTRTNHKTGRVRELGANAAGEDIRPHVLRSAAAFMMFWPGAPCIYYGDEMGVCGFTDPDNRRTMPDKPLDPNIFDFYKKIISLRKTLPLAREGSVKILYAGKSVLVFARFDRENSIFCIFSGSAKEEEIMIPIWCAGRAGYEENEKLEIVMTNGPEGFSFEPRDVFGQYGNLTIKVPAFTSMIIE